MTYEITLDRDACEGIFACLVRDERFVEASDGLAELDSTAGEDSAVPDGDTLLSATFEDDRLAEAERAAAACPVNAIEVGVTDSTGATADE